MIMLMKSFNAFAIVFFVPLVFIGAFFLLNLTLAVIKSKFTEKHNDRKNKFINKAESPEEIEKKELAEKSRINRKIKPHIKQKLFGILKRIRDRLEPNEVVTVESKKSLSLKRPMSIVGALRRDIFNDDDDDDFFKKYKKTKIEGNPELVQEYKELKRKKSIIIDNHIGLLSGESSGSFEPSSNSESSKNSEESKGEGSGEESSSSEENQVVINKKNTKKGTPKVKPKSKGLSVIKVRGKRKWKNKLNISRDTIYEVDEEHKSDTTHRMSLGLNKLMGSSDHKSSTRRFNKVLSTLKGNSPNSSMLVVNKVMSASSDPYYEQNDSPLLNPSKGCLDLVHIKANIKRKENSSRNVREKLEENRHSAIKSDRSERAKNNNDFIYDNEDDYIRKINSDEIKLPINYDESPKNKDFAPVMNNLMAVNFSIEKISSIDLKTSSNCSAYIVSENSPIISSSSIYESHTGKTYTELKSLKNTELNDIQQYGQLSEEEKKLSSNESQSSINSDKNNIVKNEKYKLATVDIEDTRSVRQNDGKKFDKKIKMIKSEYNKRPRFSRFTPEKLVSNSEQKTISSIVEARTESTNQVKRSVAKVFKGRNRRMLSKNETMKPEYTDSLSSGFVFVENKEFINERKRELEKAKNENQWKAVADLFKVGNTQNIISKNPTRKVAPQKLVFKYKSIKDVLEEKEESSIKEVSKWDKFWQESDSKQYEKRIQMHPQIDYGILADDYNPDEGFEFLDEQTDEPEIISRNRALQDKYDEDFHSHIISTGTVSIVAEPRNKLIFNRQQLNPTDISFDDSLIRFQTPIYVEKTPQEKSKENPKMTSIALKNLVATAITAKVKQKNNSSSLADIMTKDKISKNSSLMNSKFKSRKVQRKQTIILDSKSKNRTTTSLSKIQGIGSLIPTSKGGSRINRARLDLNNKAQIEALLDHAINIEKESYKVEDTTKDYFVDAEFDLNEAILNTKNRERRKRVITVEWSGQDIIEALEPNRVSSIMNSFNNIKVFRHGYFRPLFKMQHYLESFVLHSAFENFMTLCVTLNTLILAIDHYGIDKDLERIFTNMNLAFTIIFCVEMCLKILGQGARNYLRERMNYLDGSVVILSIVELAFLSGSGGALSAFRTVRIFRTFRVLRVARLLRTMQSMQTIIGVISRSISSFIYLALLLLLFIFIYSLMGMQLFGGQFKDFPDEIPRANFDSFTTAFLTVFQILTMENWQSILYTSMSQSGWTVPIYLISWIFIGNFVLLNLFLAILLDSFIEEDEEEKKEMEDNDQISSIKGDNNDDANPRSNLDNKKDEELLKAIEYQINHEMGHGDDNKDGKKFIKTAKKKTKTMNALLDESIEITHETLARQQTEIKPSKALYEGIECQNAFFFISKMNPIRLYAYKLIEVKGFETFILVLIILSSVKLIGDTYILEEPSDSTIVVLSNYFDLFFIIFFAIESLLKSLAMGLLFDNGSYLRESWNQLDFFIVVSSIIDLSFDNINVPVIKILRLLRTLRPLRFISHNSGMKIVVEALIQSVGHIFNVLIVVLVVWLMFAILGVNLFGGKFQY